MILAETGAMILAETGVMNFIGEIVSNYAFPIVMCFLLFKQNENNTVMLQTLVNGLLDQNQRIENLVNRVAVMHMENMKGGEV